MDFLQKMMQPKAKKGAKIANLDPQDVVTRQLLTTRAKAVVQKLEEVQLEQKRVEIDSDIWWQSAKNKYGLRQYEETGNGHCGFTLDDGAIFELVEDK